MRHPHPEQQGELIPRNIRPPSDLALRTILGEAQRYTRYPVERTTRLTELAPHIAAPLGYAQLMIGHGFEYLELPRAQPEILDDVARIFDHLCVQRDRLSAVEATRPAPAPAPAPAPPRPVLTRATTHTSSRGIKPWHVLAAMIGGVGLFISYAMQETSAVGYVIPIVSALLVGWMLSRVLPIWVPAAVLGGVAFLAVLKIQRLQHERDEAFYNRKLDRAITEVCNGRPLNLPPKGAKLRNLYQSASTSDYWLESNSWPEGLIPTYVLCTRRSSEEAQCGDFVETGRSDARPTRLCTHRMLANVTLRRTQTAEVVFAQEYRGGPPPALSYSVRLGGRGSTQLSGPEVSYNDDIYPDIKPFLDKP